MTGQNAHSMEIPPVFRCPCCGRGLEIPEDAEGASCGGCGFEVQAHDGILLLVKDRAAVERAIHDAKQDGRQCWYEDEQAAQFTGPYRHHMRKRIAYLDSVFGEYARRAGRALNGLDLCCGDGNNLRLLARHVPELYACDYNIERLARARRVPGVRRVFMAEVLNLPVADAAFDMILFNHALEHIADDAGALAQAHRALKPGGLCVLGVPNEGAAFWRLAYALQPRARAESDHVQFYTAAAISEKCARAGFTVTSVHHMGWGVPHWRLDSLVRGYKIVDDALEAAGRALLKSQATSLYLLLTK
jgi:SAM-dependent methyltransferase